MRLTWDECWLQVARVVAQRSRCARWKTGAVIVSRHNRIVATGYIGPPAGIALGADKLCDTFCTRGRDGPTDETRVSYSDCTSIHSELNALLVCDRRDRDGGTIYVTSGPCWTCAKAIANSGLRRAVIVDTSREHVYRNLDQSYKIICDAGLDLDLRDAP